MDIYPLSLIVWKLYCLTIQHLKHIPQQSRDRKLCKTINREDDDLYENVENVFVFLSKVAALAKNSQISVTDFTSALVEEEENRLP